MTPERLAKINNVVNARQQGIVVLEDIHDPHNAQAVFRTCDCLGFQQLYVIFERERTFNPTKIGKLSSSSANKWLDIKLFTSSKECFEELKTQGYKIYATALSDKAKSIYENDFQEEKLAMVFGNEHTGISDVAFDYCDQLITIPMLGMVQSLNLSVTAAISLFEITRQRTVKGMDKFVLDLGARDSLAREFAER